MITVRSAAGLIGGFVSLYPIFTTPTLPEARIMTSTSALPARTAGAVTNVINETNDDVVYWACLSPDFRAPISGFVNFTTPSLPPPSKGTGIVVDITILDGSRGPFTYHIHERQLYSHGDCESAAGHFDPLGPPSRPANYVCDPADRASCEAGDLSGKYGKIPAFYGSVSVYTTWSDEFLSVKRGEKTFVGGRSLVVHAKNGDRIACADIIEGGVHPMIGKEGMWGEWRDDVDADGPGATTGAAKPVTTPGTSATETKIGTTESTSPTKSASSIIKPTNSIKPTSSIKSTSSASSIKSTSSATSTTTTTTTLAAMRSTSTLFTMQRQMASRR